jgi:hypothetical protein
MEVQRGDGDAFESRYSGDSERTQRVFFRERPSGETPQESVSNQVYFISII